MGPDDFQEPKWFKFNDDSVSIVDLEQAETSAVGILFDEVPGKIGNSFVILFVIVLAGCFCFCRNYQRSPNSNLV